MTMLLLFKKIYSCSKIISLMQYCLLCLRNFSPKSGPPITGLGQKKCRVQGVTFPLQQITFLHDCRRRAELGRAGLQSRQTGNRNQRWGGFYWHRDGGQGLRVGIRVQAFCWHAEGCILRCSGHWHAANGLRKHPDVRPH